jgi:hypothetical protein
MPKLPAPEDKARAREIWAEHLGKGLGVRGIYNKIQEKFEREIREPFSESTLRNWIKQWPVKPTEDDLIIPLWDKSWGNNAQDIATLTHLYDVGRQVWEEFGEFATNRGFTGLPRSVCKWGPKLAGHFDLTVRHECLALLYFAYVFGKLERYSEIHSVALSEISKSATRLLVLWAGTKNSPNLAPNKIIDSWFNFLWRQDERLTELEVCSVMLDEYLLEGGLLVPEISPLDTFLDWSEETGPI